MTTPTTSTSEPVLIAHTITAVLMAGVALGWWAFPTQPVVNAIGTVAALIVSVIAGVVARGQVTPVGSDPAPTWADIEHTITEMATQIAQQQIDSYVAKGAP